MIIASGSAKWVQPLWKTVWQFVTELNILLLYNPAVMILGIYPKSQKVGPHKTPRVDVYSSFIHSC